MGERSVDWLPPVRAWAGSRTEPATPSGVSPDGETHTQPFSYRTTLNRAVAARAIACLLRWPSCD